MALSGRRTSIFPVLILLVLVLYARPASAFGAGNIASISKLEGKNWRHGDIEDVLKTIGFLSHHHRKWTSNLIKRVYFGNWLRDYSQAMDVGTLKSVQADTIRILVWVLSFLTFGYATEEFEVTSERLGVYQPVEHIDNPKDYADNSDARQYDSRLRGPVQQIELDIDPTTGMKNYIANDQLGIATSSGYVRFSLSRSIHFGRLYTNGAGGSSGNNADLYEGLRCLGQALHTMEDFGAHTNYVELVLREMGYHNVFPHVGSATEMNLNGRRAFPLVTGSFGLVDFLHSVLGEATDHFAQSEVDELNKTLADAQGQQGENGARAFGDSGPASASGLTNLLSQVPGAGSLCQQAHDLQAASDAQEAYNAQTRGDTFGADRAPDQQPSFQGPPGSTGGPPGPGIPGFDPNFDPQATIKKIYPILEFRDKVVRSISAVIEKIPGLEALVEKITETLTAFVLRLLAPFIRPIIDRVAKQLKTGSSGVVDASAKHQYEPWTDQHCTDPTHSLLSKDHFYNILNEPAGKVAASILQYVVPRVIYAWEHPDISVDQVLQDVSRVFHHPALRDHQCEIHNSMFATVERWAREYPGGHSALDQILSSDSVRHGKNHTNQQYQGGAGAYADLGQTIPGYSNVSNLGGNLSSNVTGKVSQFLNPLKKFGNVPGLSRDGEDLEAEISSKYPGTRTQYDSVGQEYPQGQYLQQQPLPQQQQYSGDNSIQNQSYIGDAPPPQQHQFGYGPPGDSYGQPYAGYQEQQPYPSQYGGGQNAPPPQGAYGYGGPSPGQGGYYGGSGY